MHWLPAILILPYVYFLLKIYRSLLKIEPHSLSAEPAIFVSVIVACRNEQHNLPNLLESLAAQNYPTDLYEVIIVDDNSTDKTFEIAARFNQRINVVTVYNKGIGKKKAIRTGIDISSGNLIITTDADCIMGSHWLKTIASYYEKHKPDMIVSPVQLGSGPGFFRKFQELEFLSLQGITAGSVSMGDGTMCNGANLSFTKKSYLLHSGNLHNEIASGDDIFFLHSLKRDPGSKILWLESPDSVVTAALSGTPGSFLKQRRRWLTKGKAYTDRFTITLGIVTFVTIMIILTLLGASLANHAFIPVFLVALLIKSIPDFLILRNCTARYGKKPLMKWFIPSQLIYPFYALVVTIYSLLSPREKDINFPFPKET